MTVLIYEAVFFLDLQGQKVGYRLFKSRKSGRLNSCNGHCQLVEACKSRSCLLVANEFIISRPVSELFCLLYMKF